MLTKAPKGTKDILPYDSYKWNYIENIIRNLCSNFGYRELRTPTFEHTELFLRGVGDTTDIVQKEMYTFKDKGDRSITLKPEGTAGAARSFIENNMYNDTLPQKMFYFTPVFRYENPQAGRLREHHQFGIEVFGASKATIDAEVISLALNVFKTLGVKGLQLNINSIGCPDCRPKYNKILTEYLMDNEDKLCDTCKERMHKNPLRALDCKQKSCQETVKNAPLIIDYLCDDCKEHFESLKKCLNSAGIEFKVNPFIVRGLDYYTKTVFEIVSNSIGSQGTVCGGGRYDGLVEQCGGPSVPGIGFGMGIERLLIVMESQNIVIPKPELYDAFICTMGSAAMDASFPLLLKLRENGVKAEIDHTGRSIKAQFKYANKINAKYVIVIGEDELKNNSVKLKNMQDGNEEFIKMEDILSKMKELKNKEAK